MLRRLERVAEERRPNSDHCGRPRCEVGKGDDNSLRQLLGTGKRSKGTHSLEISFEFLQLLNRRDDLSRFLRLFNKPVLFLYPGLRSLGINQESKYRLASRLR